MSEYHVIVDSCVLLNLLDVPGRNEYTSDVKEAFRRALQSSQNGANKIVFYLPWTTILETGNHIAGVKGGGRYSAAERFERIVRRALDQDDRLWEVLPPLPPAWEGLLREFKGLVPSGIGWGDMMIIQDAKRISALCKTRGAIFQVCIWTLDNTLRGYSPAPCDPLNLYAP